MQLWFKPLHIYGRGILKWNAVQSSVGVEQKEMEAPFGSSTSTEDTLKMKCFALPKLSVYFQSYMYVSAWVFLFRFILF